MYSDPNDLASDLEQRERDFALQAAKNYKGLVSTGYCYNCNEPLPSGQLFCPRGKGEQHCCRSDFELRQSRV
jgi:hypothetical protein